MIVLSLALPGWDGHTAVWQAPKLFASSQSSNFYFEDFLCKFFYTVCDAFGSLGMYSFVKLVFASSQSSNFYFEDFLCKFFYTVCDAFGSLGMYSFVKLVWSEIIECKSLK